MAWGVSCFATLGSLYFSEVMKFEPCILCWYQRILMYPFVLWIGLAIKRKDYQITYYSLPISGIGGCISLYHYLIQKFALFSKTDAICGRVPCMETFINWYGFITIPLLAFIAFCMVGACSFIVIQINRNIRNEKKTYVY
ncbi:disulfide oxidoreductase [Bacillus cereus]|uniref:disulfide oxidoreductase n=1 Tax=Bacillus cereus TaxID=1396 RepID=UPI00114E0DFE|nr:disulfide oxidoreductase [Bacillus cereus]